MLVGVLNFLRVELEVTESLELGGSPRVEVSVDVFPRRCEDPGSFAELKDDAREVQVPPSDVSEEGSNGEIRDSIFERVEEAIVAIKNDVELAEGGWGSGDDGGEALAHFRGDLFRDAEPHRQDESER